MRRRMAITVLALGLLVTGPGNADVSASLVTPTEIGEAIVGFDAGAMPVVATGEPLLGFPVLRIDPDASFVVVAAPDLAAVRRAVAAIPGVTYVEDNVLLRAFVAPNDSRYGEQYGPPMMGFPDAWGEAGFGSRDVTVGVLDSGILKSHSDFESARILTGRDYVNNDSNPNDDCGHGTHVTGTVAATTNNGAGVAGMSQSTILPMKVLSPIGFLINVQCAGSTDQVATAIRDATDQGARVISMSLGSAGSSNTLAAAVDYAWSHDVLVVAAAGNDGPCSNCVNYPAKYGNAIAVSALTSSKVLASYSSTGPEVEIAAPGSSVLSTYNDGGYRSLSGTSMATPHVAGALALGLSCKAAMDAPSLRALLQQTAEDLGSAGRDNNYGFGLARADRLIDALGGCGTEEAPGNSAPHAALTVSTVGLTVGVDGSGSSDADGDPLDFEWSFGDGATAAGVTASHTYAAGGTYAIALTVSDGRGASDTAVQTVTVAAPGDPDPSTPTLSSGQRETVTLSGAGADKHYKVFVPAGSSQLRTAMTGPSCGLFGCSFDADLYVRFGARATDRDYNCRPYLNGNNESCTTAAPTGGWWYLRVKSYAGSGSVDLTSTVSP